VTLSLLFSVSGNLVSAAACEHGVSNRTRHSAKRLLTMQGHRTEAESAAAGNEARRATLGDQRQARNQLGKKTLAFISAQSRFSSKSYTYPPIFRCLEPTDTEQSGQRWLQPFVTEARVEESSKPPAQVGSTQSKQRGVVVPKYMLS
jgi:hypothetical protein